MWKSTIETIYNCPVVKGTIGIIQVIPSILRTIAGATREEKDEWLIVLMGSSAQDGRLVTIDDFYVPVRQERWAGHCDIDEEKYPFPPEVKRRMLGYSHSHHVMEANFSGVDTGINGFNQRGQISIVTSSKIPFTEGPLKKFAQLVGFSYSAVIRHKLQCGAWGKSYAEIIPAGIANWPLNTQVIRPTGVGTVKHLGDCQRHQSGEGSDDFHIKRLGNCGWHEEEAITRSLIFGLDGSKITDALPRAQIYNQGKKVHLPPAGSTYRDQYHDDDTIEESFDTEAWREYLIEKYGEGAVQEALVRITD